MRYPFLSYVNSYMQRMKDVYAPITWETTMRRYQRINKDLLKLHQKGEISTTSPKSMTMDDARVYLTYRRSLGYSEKEYAHDQAAMKNIFRFVKNIAYEDCLMQYPLLKARTRRHTRFPSLTDEMYKTILSKANAIEPYDYRRYRAYALVLLAIRAGTRTKEIRLAELNDLDTTTWTFYIVHVKGEGSYGEPRCVPIHPDIRHVLEKYLELREKWLIANSARSDALFPSSSSHDGFLTGNSLRSMKRLVENEVGVKFDFRDCRRTFGQQLLDSDVDIESVSVAMGHSTTVTTELFYARKRNDKANKNIKEHWKNETDSEHQN